MIKAPSFDVGNGRITIGDSVIVDDSYFAYVTNILQDGDAEVETAAGEYYLVKWKQLKLNLKKLDLKSPGISRMEVDYMSKVEDVKNLNKFEYIAPVKTTIDYEDIVNKVATEQEGLDDIQRGMLRDFADEVFNQLEEAGFEIVPPPGEKQFTVSQIENGKLHFYRTANNKKFRGYLFIETGIATKVVAVFEDGSEYDITDYSNW